MTMRIKEARERVGLSQKELAKKLNIKPTTFNGYETGAHDPKSNILLQIARQCNTTIDYLLGLTDNPDMPHKNSYISLNNVHYLEKYNKLDTFGKNTVHAVIEAELQRIRDNKDIKKHKTAKIIKFPYSMPYYDLPASAGTGEFLDSDNYTMLDLKQEPPQGATFIVRVHGDSMEPTYYDGQKLFIKQQPEIEIGENGIFMVNGDMYVKERAADGLISHNAKYADIKFKEYDNIRCYGKVIGIVEE